MGRYYSSQHFSGKFGFAIQSSSDPEIFGMEEEDPCTVDYYLDGGKENEEQVKKVIDEQYDILGFPQEKRIYTIEKEEELDPLYDELTLYVYKAVANTPENKTIIGYGGGGDWYQNFPEGKGLTEKEFDKKYKIVPKKEGSVLAKCRIMLGIKILSELKLDGYCSLTAEL